MSFNTEATKTSKGLTKNEAVSVMQFIGSHKKSFSIVGGSFRESKLEKLIPSGSSAVKVSHVSSFIEKTNGITFALARHLLSCLNVSLPDASKETLTAYFGKAIDAVAKK